MPDAKPTKKRRWRYRYLTCPVCGEVAKRPKHLVTPMQRRTRSRVCPDNPTCQLIVRLTNQAKDSVVRLIAFDKRRRRQTRWREHTPEGREFFRAKYGPESGRPAPYFDITRLRNSPKYPQYEATKYRRALEKERNLNALLGMFNMARKASYPVLTPQAASRLRGSIMRRVPKYLEMADEVISGDRKWSATQARVFATLLNKVVPDLSASFVQHEHTTRDLRELSREELERIARGDDAITVEYSDASHESRETAPILDHDAPGAGQGDEAAGPQGDPARES